MDRHKNLGENPGMESDRESATTENTAQGEWAVETRGLTKRYPLTWSRKILVALNSLDLKVRKGEVFGLLGPNGSGKSTTLKILLGLVQQTSGEAFVFGKSPDSLEARARVGFLPENPYFYGFLTGDETVQYFGRLCGLSGAKLKDKTEELIQLVGLQNGRERPLRSYSKGMLQRIGLAQALVHDPDLIFLDEPTAGVDPLGSSQIRDLILALKKMGKTVIFSSHLLEQVEEVADRVAVFALGNKLLEGSLAELLTEETATQLNIKRPLSAKTQDKLQELLIKEGLTMNDISFTHPRMTLEQLYLKTVTAPERK